jgi:TonB-linked SusC/RagA family outer membrane protein
MRKNLLSMSLLMLLTCLVHAALAQDRAVSGQVTSTEEGTPLPGVNVVLRGTSTGTVTDADGKYQLTIPGGSGTLLFSFIGLQTQEIEVGSQTVINVALSLDVTQLGEIVVTGVSQGTSVKKLGFAIGKVNSELLSEVPAPDAANALRGKVSGLQVVQGSGLQGNAASIRLRGATTLSTGVNQEPLIIIDGVISPPGSSSLADINMNDVESIEVVKGAAGAALYGSLAGNGVIQIITKRGKTDKTKFTFRNEFGFSELQRTMDVNNHHHYQTDASGEIVRDPDGTPIDDTELIDFKPYKTSYNQQKRLFKSNPYSNNYFSISTTQGRTSFFTSLDNYKQGGIIDGLQDFKRQNIRLNVDHDVNDRFRLNVSTLYTHSTGPMAASEGEQGGFIYEVVRLSPATDAYAPNFDGQPYITTNIGGNFNDGRNSNNPLYTSHFDRYNRTRDRIMGNFGATYEVTPWWKVDGQISYDRATNKRERFRDKKYLNNTSTPDAPYANSYVAKSDALNTAKVYSITSTFNKTFNNFNVGLSLRYQAEDYTTSYLEIASTSNIVVDGVNQTPNIPSNALSTYSSNEVFRAENYFANLKLDYASKYLVDALFRRDASSLFGANEREQYFYRVSGAYRISEDLKIPGVQEFKIRASLGTSGQRPPFLAQYESVPLFNGNYVLGLANKGNPNLKPSRITEFEAGININFLERFSAEINYAKSDARDQILRVPLSVIGGYSSQWQNAGAIESKTFEFSIAADIVKKKAMSWNIGIVGSRSASTVTELNRPPFGYTGGTVGSGNIFLITPGEHLGAIYGGVLATSLSELQVDETGMVTNLEGIVDRPVSDFVINRDGFVILNGTEFTSTERPYNLVDPVAKTKINKKIGDSTPDLILGVNTTFQYKGFTLYLLVDSQIGGNIANVNKQNLMFNEIAPEFDQSGYPEGQRKYNQYFVVLSNSGSAPNQYFIEDATFTTIREVSLAYRFDHNTLSRLGKIGNALNGVKLAVSGRNLHTFTNYTGWTPEVGASGGNPEFGGTPDIVETNPFNFRADYGSVPLFRTFAVSLELTF